MVLLPPEEVHRLLADGRWLLRISESDLLGRSLQWPRHLLFHIQGYWLVWSSTPFGRASTLYVYSPSNFYPPVAQQCTGVCSTEKHTWEQLSIVRDWLLQQGVIYAESTMDTELQAGKVGYTLFSTTFY